VETSNLTYCLWLYYTPFQSLFVIHSKKSTSVRYFHVQEKAPDRFCIKSHPVLVHRPQSQIRTRPVQIVFIVCSRITCSFQFIFTYLISILLFSSTYSMKYCIIALNDCSVGTSASRYPISLSCITFAGLQITSAHVCLFLSSSLSPYKLIIALHLYMAVAQSV
jgi:hypothetical protein